MILEVVNGEVVNGEVDNGEVVSLEVVSGEVDNGEVDNGEVVSLEVVNGEVVTLEVDNGEVVKRLVVSLADVIAPVLKIATPPVVVIAVKFATHKSFKNPGVVVDAYPSPPNNHKPFNESF